MASPFLTAEWRKLIMAQYSVDPKLLTPHLPSGVELDRFEDRCYVSLVGFLFERVRIKGVPVPFHTRFEEVNLRFYVRRREAGGQTRRGVVFISEIVPRRAIAFVARTIYEEPYLAMPTRHQIDSSSDELRVSYGWKLGQRWHSLGVQVSPAALKVSHGGEEEFITEHYWGYTKRSSGSTSAYRVQHPQWQTCIAPSHQIDVDFGLLYGTAFAFLNDQPPASVLLAEGSAVSVYSAVRLPRG
jgi:uncharacterized protein YqjF (DUF2071 family)